MPTFASRLLARCPEEHILPSIGTIELNKVSTEKDEDSVTGNFGLQTVEYYLQLEEGLLQHDLLVNRQFLIWPIA